MSLSKLGASPSGHSSRRTIGILLLTVVAAAAWFAWQKYQTRSLTVVQTKQAIRNYLENKADVARFEPLPMEALVDKPGDAETVPATDKEPSSKKAQKKKKNKTHKPLEQLARDFKRSVKESADYKTTYRLIGENLARVDSLLAAPGSETTEAALVLAVGATRAALEPAVDGWLAARIAEAYLWPNLDKAPTTDKSDIDAGSLLDISENAFEAADETDNLVRNYRLLIARGNHPGKTDKFRVRLAKLLEDQQNYPEALRVLREVQDTNNPTLSRRISGMQRMLQHAKASQ